MTDSDANAGFAVTRDRSGFGSAWRPVETPPQRELPAPSLDGRGGCPAPDLSWTVPGAVPGEVPPAQERRA